MSRTRYARIFVHNDAMEAARDLTITLESYGSITEDEARTLRDVLDPLPEQDIFGHIPTVDYMDLPTLGGLR